MVSSAPFPDMNTPPDPVVTDARADMSPTRRRQSPFQLHRSRSGLGLALGLSGSEPGSRGGARVAGDATAIDSRPPEWLSTRPGPGRRPGRGRGPRMARVKSLTLTVLGDDRPPLTLDQGVIRIGSDPGNELVLQADGVQPVHARVTLDQDGAMLRLAKADLAVRLNHRKVESLAFLHDGDLIEVGGNGIAVQVVSEGAGETRGDRPADERSTRVRRVPPKFVLRGVTGSQFGKLIPIYGRLVIGRGSDCDLALEEPGLSRRHAIVETLPEGLFLRDLGSANGSFLNGTRVRDAALKHGDQIVLDSVRFLVQAIDQIDQPGHAAASVPLSQRSQLFGWVLMAGAVFCVGVGAALLLLR
jgi:pSer/pThr/pTyr-binding forkhead associated (FHA) protein